MVLIALPHPLTLGIDAFLVLAPRQDNTPCFFTQRYGPFPAPGEAGTCVSAVFFLLALHTALASVAKYLYRIPRPPAAIRSTHHAAGRAHVYMLAFVFTEA